MLFECLQDVLGGRAGFFLAVNKIDSFLLMLLVRTMMLVMMMVMMITMMIISNQVNSYLVDITSENTRTARSFLIWHIGNRNRNADDYENGDSDGDDDDDNCDADNDGNPGLLFWRYFSVSVLCLATPLAPSSRHIHKIMHDPDNGDEQKFIQASFGFVALFTINTGLSLATMLYVVVFIKVCFVICFYLLAGVCDCFLTQFGNDALCLWLFGL